MAGIDRRGFVAGLGALLGTTALVKPALPMSPFEVVTREPLFDVLRDDRLIFKGQIGRWYGIISTWPTEEEMQFGLSVRRNGEVVTSSDFFNIDSE